jgi:hypothetical protein
MGDVALARFETRVFVNMKQPPVERAGASLPFREGSAGALVKAAVRD